jgi:hypothetical protein
MGGLIEMDMLYISYTSLKLITSNNRFKVVHFLPIPFSFQVEWKPVYFEGFSEKMERIPTAIILLLL